MSGRRAGCASSIREAAFAVWRQMTSRPTVGVLSIGYGATIGVKLQMPSSGISLGSESRSSGGYRSKPLLATG
jgi:hypothetical protein